jgi:hypothetical protein
VKEVKRAPSLLQVGSAAWQGQCWSYDALPSRIVSKFQVVSWNERPDDCDQKEVARPFVALTR